MAKQKQNEYVFQTGIPFSESRRPNAYWLVQNNVEFIKDEVRAYINNNITRQATQSQFTPTNATYDPTTGLMVVTVGTHNLLPGDQVIFATGAITFTTAQDGGATQYAYPRATGAGTTTGWDPWYNKPVVITAISSDSITCKVGKTVNQTAHTYVSATALSISNAFRNYTNDSDAKCERDMGYNLIGGDTNNPVQDQPGGLLYDLRYNGNEQGRYLASTYWDGTIPQIDGDRNPERAAKQFATWLIQTHIFGNTAYTTKQSPVVTSQTINAEYVAETDAGTVVENILDNVIGEVIYYGLDNMPALSNAQVSSVRFPTKVTLDNVLLITNTSTNEVLFNFSDPTAGGSTAYVTKSVEFTPSFSYFNKFLENTDTITTVYFDKSTENKTYVQNARTLITNNKEFIKDEAVAWVLDKVNTATGGSTFDGYTYTGALIERDTATEIDGFLHDMQYGGNEKTRLQASKFWDGPTPLITGTRIPEKELKEFVRDLINNYILTKSAYTTKQSPSVTTQTFNGANAELGASDRITELTTIITTVIAGGLSTLPILDKPIINSLTDKIQIFVDQGDLKTRPYDFGTDAIERQRVANSLSMLDADFEYGLQPTKWQAIGTQRGYPSIYEVPGTDTQVTSVATDASTGTSGVGQSLITVTTASAHGFEPGVPITIKALANSIAGASRAEGSFIVNTVPTNFTFTYFAKAKVGTVNGQILSTFYTQLRKGGFYTGASIGGQNVAFSIISQGASGSFIATLGIPSGSDQIAYTGTAPEIGAPLVAVGGGIPLGSQVTGTEGTGGIVTTPVTTSDVSSGSNTITVQNVSGIVNGLGLNRGDGYATFVTNVVGNTVTLSDALTADFVGNTVQYTGLAGSNDSSIGNGATFDVSRSGGTYSVTLNAPGQDYRLGDNIVISGQLVGGSDTTNDLRLVVTSVDTGGELQTFDDTGSAFDGNGTFSNLPGELQGSIGTGGNFDIVYTNNVYSVSMASPDTSSGYVEGDVIKVDGFDIGGQSVTNDLFMKVTNTGTGGSITSVSATGTAPDASVNYASVTYTTNTAAGVGADFNVERVGTGANVSVASGGTGYLAGETFTVLGSQVGGVDGVNNLTITVATIDVNGTILTVTDAGTMVNTKTIPNWTSVTNIVGNGAKFTISLASQTYTLDQIDVAGQSYGVDQTIIIRGTDLGGATPANDLTLTITGVGSSGEVTTANIVGTGAAGTGSYTGVNGTNDANSGSNAVFNITRSGGTYSIVTATDNGSGYKKGDRIVIPGNQLGGATPTNDLTLRCDINSTEGDFLNIQISGTAVPGNTAALYSSVTMSEAATQNISPTTSITYSALATVQCDFETAHGLVPGNTFLITVESDDASNNHNLCAGPFNATAVPTTKRLQYQCRAPGAINTGTNNDDPIQGFIYPRPDSFFVHRPYDGGVQLGTGGPQHGAQAIRQSKKYIRYQSGKGIMYTTGALFAPSYDLLQVTANGTSIGSTITCTTDDTDHGLQVGGGIRLIGINTVGFNGDYVVSDINSEREFEVLAINALGSTTPELSAKAQVSVKTFHGATVRSGCFDDQNGIFFEYDGTQFSAVQRTATLQLAGVVDIAVDTNTVTGTGTRFREQLKAGDRIVIKGMTHVVSDVISNTQMSVAPDFRGVTNVLSSKLCLVQDKKTEQKDFNRDRMDGTGPSGYNIDISKMQMVGIQYSWYGAGFIDYMLRGADGNFVFGHRMRNSNINTEAFMRTGNMPVRYEVTNEGPVGKLSANVTDTATTLPLEDASFFPPEGGIVYIDNEMIQFTGVDGKNLTGCTRGAQMTNFASGATRTYSAGTAETHTRNTGVPLISNTISPIISHWGSAYITDGGFDFDRGYLFSYKATGTSISTTRYTSFLIRLAPSVSNAIVGDLGERELLNRAQLLLDGLEVTSEPNASGQKGGIVIEGVLNPQNYPVNPNDIGWEGISGLASGGQPSFAQIAAGGSVNWNGGATQTTASAVVQADIDSGFNYTRTSQYNDRYSPITIDYSPIQTIGTPLIGAYIESQNPTNAFNANQYVISGVGPLEGNGFRYRIFYTGPNGTNRASNLSTTSTTLKFIYKTYTGFTNKLLFTKASWEASGAGQGTEVASSDLNWPAGTFVQSVSSLTHCGTEFYEVTFNQTSVATISAGDSVTFLFGNPPYAQPGETIFSFIAQPGERATLNLAEIKELTNTTLGGRGTFPNGPDVLAINVYKTAGTAVDANIILRWSEAQA
tara:strand:+ start:41676 stop:48338 length:6663 start_codon:yes stop_codon:yes gene_type:complete